MIEEGLSRYGAGDLDGALALWDAVLSVDPENAQASSYVEYVRANYELLTTNEPAVEEDSAGFPMSDEPEYTVEIVENQDTATLPLAASTIALGDVDAGWDLEDEPRRDETFEDATREYQGVKARPVDPDSGPTEFGSDTFSQETNIRKRNLGFVQPTAENDADPYGDYDLIESLPTPTPTPTPPPEPEPPAERRDLSAISQAEVVLAHAPTRELDSQRDVPVSHAPTRDIASEERAQSLEPLVSAPTRDLGLRPGGRPMTSDSNLVDDEDMPTRQSDVRAIRDAAFASEAPTIEKTSAHGDATRQDVVLAVDPIMAQAAQILDDVDAGAPAGESGDDRTRRRIERLLDLASEWTNGGELDKAVNAVDLALAEDPNSALGQKLITRNKDRIMTLFQSYIGDLERMPQLARPLHELGNASINPRAAFLLSRIDGTLTVDELLDVSGMPRLEAYRHLCQLYLRGILR
jgi:hypothetical protein